MKAQPILVLSSGRTVSLRQTLLFVGQRLRSVRLRIGIAHRSRTGSAAVETDDALDLAIGKNMDDRGAIEVVSLAEFQRGERVAKGGGFVQICRPLVHVSEEEAGFYIFQDRFHLTDLVSRLTLLGVLIFANARHRARRAPMNSYSCNQEEKFAEKF